MTVKNIIDYVYDYGKYTFEEKPFNEVDSLIFSELSYVNFDGMLDGLRKHCKFISLEKLKNFENFYLSFKETLNPNKFRLLYLALISSKRFQKIKLGFYENKFSDKEELQFSAVTYKLDKKTVYVAYRGTDQTMTGWKEDFNMSFMDIIPSQIEAASYLKYVMKNTKYNVIAGGHSKGGNLAVYAAYCSYRENDKRIKIVYNHDGPGFNEKFLKDNNLDEISERVHKTVPKTAIIGMILQHTDKYNVVEAVGQGIDQHDPFSWIVENNKFKYLISIDKKSEMLNKVVNRWISSMDEETRKSFVDSLFDVVTNAKISNLQDFNGVSLLQNIKSLLNSMSGLDSEKRKLISKSLTGIIPFIFQHK